MKRHILWHCSPLLSSEFATVTEEADGCRLSGLCILPRDGEPCRIEYEVAVDAEWATRSAVATLATPRGEEHLALESDASGHWTIDGADARHLDGCTDVDLGWTPATNTLPIRRTGLELGASVTITAAWVRFPELEVVASSQRYTRTAANRWRYQSGPYDFSLVTDAESGLVLAYGSDLWRAIGPVIEVRH